MTITDRIAEWFKQQVDPAFRPLLERIAASGVPVQWEEGALARTMRLQIGAQEIAYTIIVDADSDPIVGQLWFKTPEAERCKSFLPSLGDRPGSPGEMTGPDLVNDLIDQYGQRLRTLLGPGRAAGG